MTRTTVFRTVFRGDPPGVDAPKPKLPPSIIRADDADDD